MKRILTAVIAAFAATGAMVSVVPVAQADVDEAAFKVIGLWNIGPMYKEHEAPLWTTSIPEASGGKITTEVQSITDMGLKGFETVQLLQTGVYDAGFGAYVYIASGNPVFEGIDLALAAGDESQARALVDAYKPVVGTAFDEIHGLKLLANYPYPAQILVCRDEFASLADLAGRKIRVYSTTLGDMAEGLGGVSVSIPLADVVPALQRGVIDCGVSSGTSMYAAKWFDVVKYVYETPVSSGIGFLAMSNKKWDSLGADTQALLLDQAAKFADRAWAARSESAVQGIACLTGQGGTCTYGKPADMTLVAAAPGDEAARKALLADFVLKRYAERCGADCTAAWNATAGVVAGVEAKP